MSELRQYIGETGEAAAKEFLLGKGYQWVESNFRTRGGEIDLVMKDGATLVFIEVKTRQDNQAFGAPEEAVNKPKRAHIIKGALAYLQRAGTEDQPVRFDVVSVGVNGIQHFIDAFGNDFNFYW
jgi:putative endonuclease